VNSYISMPEDRQKLICDQTAAQIGLPAHAVEKDFWVTWTLITNDIAAAAGKDLDLFQRIAEHRQVYFNWSWMAYETLQPGHLQITPPDHYLSDWRTDYNESSPKCFTARFRRLMRCCGRLKSFRMHLMRAGGNQTGRINRTNP